MRLPEKRREEKSKHTPQTPRALRLPPAQFTPARTPLDFLSNQAHDSANMTAIAVANKALILDQVAQGRRISDIAIDLGLSTHAAISKSLAKDPEYQLAREIGAEARLDQRERELESASNSVTVARARELMSQARWRAEREHPKIWGVKVEAKIDASLTVQVVRIASQQSQRTIDSEIVQITYSE